MYQEELKKRNAQRRRKRWIKKHGIGAIILLTLLGTGLYVNYNAKVNHDPEPETKMEIVGLDVVFFVDAEVTAYNAVEWQTDSTPTITASNKTVKVGYTACPVWLDFGDRVIIDGKEYECQDRMAKKYRHGNYFDIYMEDLQDARDWGRQHIEVGIIVEGKKVQ